MIKMIVFDMAGTTIDEDNLVYKTVQKSLNRYGCPATLPSVLRHAAGKEKREAIRDTYIEEMENPPDDKFLDSMHQYFRGQLDSAYDTHPSL